MLVLMSVWRKLKQYTIFGPGDFCNVLVTCTPDTNMCTKDVNPPQKSPVDGKD